LKILNLYAGIGGNRKLWEDVEVTAVEYNPEIAAIYQEYFPNDTVVVADAHEYLLQHYKEFDFIWASPPCQTHSRVRHAGKDRFVPKFPDAKLWQEIIFLKHHAVCPYVIENVIPYYDVFLEPTIVMDRHLFWSNFKISKVEVSKDGGRSSVARIGANDNHFGFSLVNYDVKHRKDHARYSATL